ncbi:MAG TPA: hypothetical protein VFQ34_13705 [Nitrospiraceae bacterium]|jgi:hypothetical protein|nr:hypothetical protein [Nitrospiraceae bacterium]
MSTWLAYGGAVLTGLVPPLIMYLIGSQKKVLGYAIVRNEPVLNIRHADIERRLIVTLDGKTLNGCRVMELAIQNLGMKDIESQTVHLTFPPGVTVLHAHCSSSTLAVGPKIDAIEADSYGVTIPLMNPDDKLVVRLLMTGNEEGTILVTAKGPNLKFRPFDPTTFISPAINRGLLVLSGGIFTWIMWACIGTDRFMGRPFWDKTITMVLVGLFLAAPSALLAYQGMIPLLKRYGHRWQRDRHGHELMLSQHVPFKP